MSNNEVEEALKEAGLWEYFCGLPPSHRREYLDWVDGAKKQETQQRRIAKMVEMLRVKRPGI